jgi:putative membrane protein
MRHLFMGASLLALLAGAPGLAGAQTNDPAGQSAGPSAMASPDTGNGPADSQMTGSTGTSSHHTGTKFSDQDRKFLDGVTSAGLAEVEAGNLAMHRAALPAVREFGRWMVTDHKLIGELLAPRAERAGVTVPSGLNEKDRAAISGLQKYNGAEFDLHYVASQVDAHKQALELFKQEAQSGENPALRAFAQHMQPMLTQHLAEVQELQGLPESSTSHESHVTTPVAPMAEAQQATPKMQEGSTPAVRRSLNQQGAAQIEKEGK